MIDITTLTQEDRGSWVFYNPGYGEGERGRIKSWNKDFVFVVYNCDDDWDNYQNYTACATKPEHLESWE